MPVHQKKRKFEMGRQPSSTKLGQRRVRPLRCRGGNYKFRALRIDDGNFSWGSETVTRKTRVLDVVYNATNNELVRTKTIVKNCIVSIDANPFRQYYLKYYDIELNKKKIEESEALNKPLAALLGLSKEELPKFVDLTITFSLKKDPAQI